METKYFICAMEIEDSSVQFSPNRSFRPFITFFGRKKAAEEWVAKKWGKYNLAPDEFSGCCLAAWEGKKVGCYGWTKVKVALFEISGKDIFTMPEEWAQYVE